MMCPSPTMRRRSGFFGSLRLNASCRTLALYSLPVSVHRECMADSMAQAVCAASLTLA